MKLSTDKAARSSPLPFRQSDALFRAVLENAAAGIVLVGMDGRIIHANQAFAEMLGGSLTDYVGSQFADLLDLDNEASTAAMLNAMGESGAAPQLEHQYRRRDGTRVWALSSFSNHNSEQSGAAVYLIVHTVNIERQKRAEQALAQSESRWNFALEAAGQGVWDHDVREDRMYYSRMWRVMRGFRPDEEVDDSQEAWLARLHPDDVPRIKAVVKKQDDGEMGFDTLEYRERHRDGHWISILSRGRPVEWAPDGTPIRTVGTDTDVTRMKAVEAELAQEKERLRVTLEAIGDGVLSVDEESRIVFINPAGEQLTGWSARDAAGRPHKDLLLLLDLRSGEPARDPVSECLTLGRPSHLDSDVVLSSRTGRRFDVRCVAAPLHGADNRISGAVLVFQDISESKSLQRELARAASHDALTDLPNRAAFERRLEAAVEQARAQKRRHALCVIDLDRFKAVNDGAGHAAGDALLKEIAAIFRQHCREHDMCARLGGDEFALLMADCPIALAELRARSLADAVGALKFVWRGSAWSIGASIGLTTVKGSTPSAASLLEQADSACYEAKAAGRGGVFTYASGTSRERPA